MSETVSDFLVGRLAQWGVKRIFGYPGDGINGLMGALRRAEETMEFVQVRHEEMAAFMACAHAKFTGELGVCMATSGPGAIHLLNGLYDAKMDHQPVLAIVGQSALAALGGDYQQEVDLVSLFKDVAHEYVQQASDPVQIRHLVDRAARIAISMRTVTCLIIPNDLQEHAAVAAAAHAHATIHSSSGVSVPRIIPTKYDLQKAADILNEAKKPAMLVGAGCLRAAKEVALIADALQCGVAKALLGKAALPDDLPWVTGSIGLLGTKPSYDMMQECDALLTVGSSFPYPEFLPKEGQARGIQIDIDPRMLGIRYPFELNLVGDSAESLRALLPLLKQKKRGDWRKTIEQNVAEHWQVLEETAHKSANPINPELLFWELSPRLPNNCIIASDSGTSATWFARDLKIRTGMMASLSGNLATMGPGVPYAIAAKFAYPERTAFALVGDGAMQMNGINGLITISKYWQEWSNPALIVLVLNNSDLNMVTWEQRVMLGEPRFEASQDLPQFDYAQYAENLGLKGIRLTDPKHIAAAWDEALASDRPVIIDAVCDPEVPPLPPHISMEQAKNFMSAVIRDQRGGAMIRQSFKSMLARFHSHPSATPVRPTPARAKPSPRPKPAPRR